VQPAGMPTLGMPTFCHATLSSWLGQSEGSGQRAAGSGQRGARSEGPGETWRSFPDPRVLGQSAVSTSTCSQAALVRERIRIPACRFDDGHLVPGMGVPGEGEGERVGEQPTDRDVSGRVGACRDVSVGAWSVPGCNRRVL
jgi:hypothetical protein